MIRQPELGKKIADLRKAKGFTQEELVEKCNLNVRTLQRIESGEVTPRSYTIRLIFEALDFPLEKPGNDKEFIRKWPRQFYITLIDLFNLKTNTMKKISILAVMATLIILAITAINSETKAQKRDTKQVTSSDTNKVYSTQYEMAWSNFKCEECFNENGNIIGRDIRFDYNGIHMDVKLISLNKMTREFNAGFAKGILREQRVEVSIEKFLLDDKVISYTADKIDKSKNTISLFGNAILTYGKDEGVIKTNEIVITIE